MHRVFALLDGRDEKEGNDRDGAEVRLEEKDIRQVFAEKKGPPPKSVPTIASAVISPDRERHCAWADAQGSPRDWHEREIEELRAVQIRDGSRKIMTIAKERAKKKTIFSMTSKSVRSRSWIGRTSQRIRNDAATRMPSESPIHHTRSVSGKPTAEIRPTRESAVVPDDGSGEVGEERDCSEEKSVFQAFEKGSNPVRFNKYALATASNEFPAAIASATRTGAPFR